jgi:hypothetical protein
MYHATTRQVLLDGNNFPLFPRAVFSGILKREYVVISGALTSSTTNIIWYCQKILFETQKNMSTLLIKKLILRVCFGYNFFWKKSIFS